VIPSRIPNIFICENNSYYGTSLRNGVSISGATGAIGSCLSLFLLHSDASNLSLSSRRGWSAHIAKLRVAYEVWTRA
jgi:hypothetical protein